MGRLALGTRNATHRRAAVDTQIQRVELDSENPAAICGEKKHTGQKHGEMQHTGAGAGGGSRKKWRSVAVVVPVAVWTTSHTTMYDAPFKRPPQMGGAMLARGICSPSDLS